MSIYAVLDGDAEGGDQIGTITGWGDFCRWVDGLEDEDAYQEIIHLAENGWCQNLADLQSQMEAAGTATPPEDEDTKDVCRTLLQVIVDRGEAEVLTITDGLSPGGDEESDDDEPADEPPKDTTAIKNLFRSTIDRVARRVCFDARKASKNGRKFSEWIEGKAHDHREVFAEQVLLVARVIDHGTADAVTLSLDGQFFSLLIDALSPLLGEKRTEADFIATVDARCTDFESTVADKLTKLVFEKDTTCAQAA